MVRYNGSTKSEAETNEAAWEAARGAVVGATKVCLLRGSILHDFGCDVASRLARWIAGYSRSIPLLRS